MRAWEGDSRVGEGCKVKKIGAQGKILTVDENITKGHKSVTIIV
jgi:hypothetical protein